MVCSMNMMGLFFSVVVFYWVIAANVSLTSMVVADVIFLSASE